MEGVNPTIDASAKGFTMVNSVGSGKYGKCEDYSDDDVILGKLLRTDGKGDRQDVLTDKRHDRRRYWHRWRQ